MSKTVWTLVISLGLAFTVAICIGIRVGKSFVERIKSTKVPQDLLSDS
jgi:hypothetical protein